MVFLGKPLFDWKYKSIIKIKTIILDVTLQIVIFKQYLILNKRVFSNEPMSNSIKFIY
jgi:hypothetical protein